jgi:serralysin
MAIYGDSGHNTLYGTNSSDISIFGYAGNDTIYGYGGDDIIDAGDIVDGYNDHLSDNDTVYGGNGNDTILGRRGDDSLYGEAGNDGIWGEQGNDLLVGGAGDDWLYGGSGNDGLFGDEVIGSVSGNDTLYGGDGNDLIYGGKGDDKLYGDAGDDFLNGYQSGSYGERDTLTGGTGADTFGLGYNGSWSEVGYSGDGSAGYAVITDFKYWEGDKVRLGGTESNYQLKLENWSGSSSLDTAIYYGTDLIGVVQDTTNFFLSLDVNWS